MSQKRIALIPHQEVQRDISLHITCDVFDSDKPRMLLEEPTHLSNITN